MTSKLLISSDNGRHLIYPRVLVVTSSNFNLYTGTGILLTNLFKGWPISNIAIVHKDDFQNEISLCNNSYKLSFKDYAFPLSMLSSINKENSKNSEIFSKVKPASFRRKVINFLIAKVNPRSVYEKLNDVLGGPEVYSKYILSEPLKDWINQFNPQILYCHVSSLMNIRFVSELQKSLRIPLCIHIMDDWFNVRYTKGIFASKLKTNFHKEFKTLLEQTSLRMGIGRKMCDAYEKEFGYSFQPFSNAVDPRIWLNQNSSKQNANEIFRIVYSGTINSKNICNLEVISKVVESLYCKEGICKLEIYTFHPRVDIYRPLLERKPGVTISEIPNNDKNMISLLSKADLLFLPVDFTSISVERMRFSIFAKLPAYMMSGTPILIYGPPEVASIEYAIEDQWAYVVAKQDKKALKQAIRKLILDPDLRKNLGEKAQKIGQRDFDVIKIRKQFASELTKVSFPYDDNLKDCS